MVYPLSRSSAPISQLSSPSEKFVFWCSSLFCASLEGQIFYSMWSWLSGRFPFSSFSWHQLPALPVVLGEERGWHSLIIHRDLIACFLNFSLFLSCSCEVAYALEFSLLRKFFLRRALAWEVTVLSGIARIIFIDNPLSLIFNGALNIFLVTLFSSSSSVLLWG